MAKSRCAHFSAAEVEFLRACTLFEWYICCSSTYEVFKENFQIYNIYVKVPEVNSMKIVSFVSTTQIKTGEYFLHWVFDFLLVVLQKYLNMLYSEYFYLSKRNLSNPVYIHCTQHPLVHNQALVQASFLLSQQPVR